jgi:hypothetical protein
MKRQEQYRILFQKFRQTPEGRSVLELRELDVLRQGLLHGLDPDAEDAVGVACLLPFIKDWDSSLARSALARNGLEKMLAALCFQGGLMNDLRRLEEAGFGHFVKCAIALLLRGRERAEQMLGDFSFNKISSTWSMEPTLSLWFNDPLMVGEGRSAWILKVTQSRSFVIIQIRLFPVVSAGWIRLLSN